VWLVCQRSGLSELAWPREGCCCCYCCCWEAPGNVSLLRLLPCCPTTTPHPPPGPGQPLRRASSACHRVCTLPDYPQGRQDPPRCAAGRHRWPRWRRRQCAGRRLVRCQQPAGRRRHHGQHRWPHQQGAWPAVPGAWPVSCTPVIVRRLSGKPVSLSCCCEAASCLVLVTMPGLRECVLRLRDYLRPSLLM
jgi:hypothetical protein